MLPPPSKRYRDILEEEEATGANLAPSSSFPRKKNIRKVTHSLRRATEIRKSGGGKWGNFLVGSVVRPRGWLGRERGYGTRQFSRHGEIVLLRHIAYMVAYTVEVESKKWS